MEGVCNEWRGGCAMSGGRDVRNMEFGSVVGSVENMVLPVTLHHPPLSLTPLLSSSLSLSHRELRQLSSMWTREQEEELAELYERFKEEEGISQP